VRSLGLPLLGALLSCGDAVSPFPTLPDPPRLPAVITEWQESEPQFVDRAVFHYDQARRLTRYDFGRVTASDELVITYYVLYDYSDTLLTRTETHVRDGDIFRHVGESEYTYDASGRVVHRLQRTLDEVTGAVHEATTQYEYDASGRLAAMATDGKRSTYTYDAAGNIVTEEVAFDDVPTLVYHFRYDPSFNPLGAPPPRLDGVLSGFGQSAYNLISWTSGEPNKPPAATATIAYVLDEHRYPLSRRETVVNTAYPDVLATFIAEIAYVE
jgi:hypothetical protein